MSSPSLSRSVTRTGAPRGARRASTTALEQRARWLPTAPDESATRTASSRTTASARRSRDMTRGRVVRCERCGARRRVTRRGLEAVKSSSSYYV